MDPRGLEGQLLDWAEVGWLRYRGTGRDMLLAVPDPPPDAQKRVDALLADYDAGQVARISEIMAYATTKSCRHGYISRYFGGRPIEQCRSCDNCLEMGTVASSRTRRPPVARPAPAVPDAVTAAILQGVVELPFALGRRGLARALQGASTSPVSPERFPSFGALSGWTQKSIAQQSADLEDHGLLTRYKKGKYRLLRLTDEGQRWLERYRLEHSSSNRPALASPEVPQASEPVEHLSDSDQALFEALRAWRLEVAKEKHLTPYCILHNSVLRRISATRPSTPQQLLAIRGIGPQKLAQYGGAILEIAANHSRGLHTE
jgi:ATP-dependent DNA helicase RecQ